MQYVDELSGYCIHIPPGDNAGLERLLKEHP
jgi:hypothetical protein